MVEAEDKNIGKIFGYKAQAHKSGEYDLHLRMIPGGSTAPGYG